MNIELYKEFEDVMTDLHNVLSLVKILRYICDNGCREDFEEIELNYLIEIIDNNICKAFENFDELEHKLLYENDLQNIKL